MKNVALRCTLAALLPALLAVSTTASADNCRDERDAETIALIRADTWCSAAPSEFTDAMCLQKIADYDRARDRLRECELRDAQGPVG